MMLQLMDLISKNTDGMLLKINNILAAKHSVCSHILIIAVNVVGICRNT